MEASLDVMKRKRRACPRTHRRLASGGLRFQSIGFMGILIAAAALTLGGVGRAAEPLDQWLPSFVAKASCAKHQWKDRGLAPIGFIKGVSISYANMYCDLKRGPSGVASVVARKAPDPNVDALEIYYRADGSDLDRLRATYALLIGEGMRESSGNPTAGFDRSVRAQKPETAEAGLFQVSYDSLDGHAVLEEIYQRYRADEGLCRLDVFMEGSRDEKVDPFGTGPAAEFQRFTKACPAFATIYAAVLLRTNRNHFGPVIRKEAEFFPACEAMLKDIEEKLDPTCTGRTNPER